MIACSEWPIALRIASSASAIGGGPQRKITVSGPGGEVAADAVIIATPAFVSAELLGDIAAQVPTELAGEARAVDRAVGGYDPRAERADDAESAQRGERREPVGVEPDEHVGDHDAGDGTGQHER